VRPGDIIESGASGRPAPPRRTLLLVGLFALLVAAAAVTFLLWGGSDVAAPSPTTAEQTGAVVLPQNPSLALIDDGGTWYVENDGNVTMSQVVVRDGSDVVVCELGTISPSERAACAAAAGKSGLTASGVGPQGQPVDVEP
jgi:hypothetical protein